MSKLFIEGCRRLSGAVTIHGAKNSALPILAASLMADGVSEIQNCPGLSDVDVKESFDDAAPKREVVIAGRMMSRRIMDHSKVM